jgi:hypothetical protein
VKSTESDNIFAVLPPADGSDEVPLVPLLHAARAQTESAMAAELADRNTQQDRSIPTHLPSGTWIRIGPQHWALAGRLIDP